MNILLMILTIGIVGGFGTSGNINNAYGLTVCMVMTVTSCFFAVAIYQVYGLFIGLSVLFCLFILLDLFYLGSVVLKVPTGGWVPLLIATCIFIFLLIWWIGERTLKSYIKEHHQEMTTDALSIQLNEVAPSLSSESDDEASLGQVKLSENLTSISRTPGIGIYIGHDLKIAPLSFTVAARRLHSFQEIVVFLEVISVASSTVLPSNRVKLFRHQSGSNALYTMEVRIGYAEQGLALSSVLEDAFAQGLPRKSYTVFSSQEFISVVHQNLFMRVVLTFYSQMKRLFPDDMHSGLFLIEPGQQVIIEVPVHL